jgi:hypothetical protein
MAQLRNPKRGSLAELVQGLLDKGYNEAVEPVLRSVASSTNDPNGIIQKRLTEFEQRVAELVAAGQTLSADDAVLRALTADLDTVMGRNVGRVDGLAETVQATGSDAAGTIQKQLALGGMTDTQARALGVQWNTPSPDAVAQLVRYAQSENFATMLERDFKGLVLNTVQNQVQRGISLGWSPIRIAREIRNTVEGLPASQVNNLTRTLQLTSYRDSTRIHQQANVAIINQVIRIAALDDRCCLSCIALHGTVIWNSEKNAGEPIPRVNDHHQGRCTSIVQVVGREVRVQTGEQWFNSLSPERQRAIAGEANYNALKANAVSLSDFPQEYEDDVFGTMLRESSLQGILGADAQQYYQRNQR